MQITGGSLNLPQRSVARALYGPTIVGGASLTSSTTQLIALSTGDWLGPAGVFTSPSTTQCRSVWNHKVSLPDRRG